MSGIKYIPKFNSFDSINGQTGGDIIITPESIGAVSTEVLLETNIPTGWIDSFKASLVIDDNTRTVTVSPKSPYTNFEFYANGVNFVKNTSVSIQFPNITNLYWFYFDVNGSLHESTTSPFSDPTNVIVANVYWNATQSKSVILGSEFHGCINRQLHLRLHSQGAIYKSGLIAGNYNLIGDGSSNSHA